MKIVVKYEEKYGFKGTETFDNSDEFVNWLLNNHKNSKIQTIERYHLCCNQSKGCWEVRNHLEEILFSGSLQEAKDYLKNL